ncbi:phosphotransferase enzyme family protein [Mucilaginibacter sp. UR6-11]|uniref:phosphotransferase enzyme family protein n=1 Tax=Mucilaginibacter sp. UR6-11 TaxID=1435644 RepID=UPI001E536834|nr:aminoglycoside phosphotransferase family protein [Mucilaginibacter sp. UR6-11]MCC8423684.1 aminoglycoside phosphotransferase family protein [Mucilaginibacter sp. UR6-11]
MDNIAAAYNFADIIAEFNTGGGEFDINVFGSGHINDTFIIRSKARKGVDFLLQKINHFVFKDIDSLMNNMVYVTNHLKEKIAKIGHPEKEVLTLIKCNNGKYYYQDAQENYWRMTNFLHNTKSYDLVTNVKQAQQGGVAFGRFQNLLCDLHPDLLVSTIPDFLNIEKRLNDFNKAIKNNSVQRSASVMEEVGFLLSRADSMNEILQLGRAGVLPLRITHNDTKFNNILLDQADEIQCVIDLDTVMPGYVAYDFGDAIRSIINTAPEDEKNLDAIQLNIPLFEGFAKGYLSQTISFLTDAELKSLMMGVLLLPYMQAVRFLTDYLEGDVYYKTRFAEHNLQRTRAQIQLLKMLEMNKEKLSSIIQNEWLNLKNTLKTGTQMIAG